MKVQTAPLSTGRQLTRLDETFMNDQGDVGKEKKGKGGKGDEVNNQQVQQLDTNKENNEQPPSTCSRTCTTTPRCRLILIFLSFMITLSCSTVILVLTVTDNRDGFITSINSISLPTVASSYLRTKYIVNNYTWNLKITSMALASCVLSALVGLVVLVLKRICKAITCSKRKDPQDVSPIAQKKQTKQPLLNKNDQPKIIPNKTIQQQQTAQKPQPHKDQTKDKQPTAAPSQPQEDLITSLSKFLLLLFSWILICLIVALGHHLSFFIDWKLINTYDINQLKLYLFIALQLLSLFYTSAIYVMIIHYSRKVLSGESLGQEKELKDKEVSVKKQAENGEKNESKVEIKGQIVEKKEEILLSPKNADKGNSKIESKAQTVLENSKDKNTFNPKNSTKRQPETQLKDLKPINNQDQTTKNIIKPQSIPKPNPSTQIKTTPIPQNKTLTNTQMKTIENAQNRMDRIIVSKQAQKSQPNKLSNKLHSTNQTVTNPINIQTYTYPTVQKPLNPAQKSTKNKQQPIQTHQGIQPFNEHKMINQQSKKTNDSIPVKVQKPQQSSKNKQPSTSNIQALPRLTKQAQKTLTQPVSFPNQPITRVSSPKLNESPTVLNLNPTINPNNQRLTPVNPSQPINHLKVPNPKPVDNVSKLIDSKSHPVSSSLPKETDTNKTNQEVNNGKSVVSILKDNTAQIVQTNDQNIINAQAIKTTDPFVLKPLVDAPKPTQNAISQSTNLDKTHKPTNMLSTEHITVEKQVNIRYLNATKTQAVKYPPQLQKSPPKQLEKLLHFQQNTSEPHAKSTIPHKQQIPTQKIAIGQEQQMPPQDFPSVPFNLREPVNVNFNLQEAINVDPHEKSAQNFKPPLKDNFTSNQITLEPQLNYDHDRHQGAKLIRSKESASNQQVSQSKQLPQNHQHPPHIYTASPSQTNFNQPNQNKHSQTPQKLIPPDQQSLKKKLSFCSGIYSIQQSSPFSTMVSNVFKSKSQSKSNINDEQVNITPVTNTNYNNINNLYHQRHDQRQQQRFQTNRARKFDVQNQVQASALSKRFSPTNKKVTMPQQHVSSQKYFKTPQIKVPKNTQFTKRQQDPQPQKRLVPLKQQVYDPYGYQSRQKNTSSQVSSYQSGAHFYHKSIKNQINKSGNRIWNHSTAYSTDNELVKRRNAKFQEKSPSSGTEMSYYDEDSFKKHNKIVQQKKLINQKQMNYLKQQKVIVQKQATSQKEQQLMRIKQEQAKIQKIYLDSQRRIQTKINMLNASIQQKQLDMNFMEESIKFMNQTNFNSVLNPVIDENKKLRLLQDQQRLQDQKQQQERERQMKIKEEKLLRLRQQHQMRQQLKLMEQSRRLQASRVNKRPKLGRKRQSSRGELQSSRGELVREKSKGETRGVDNRKKSKQVSRQTFSNGQPSIIVNKAPKGSSNQSSQQQQDLPTKQQLQIRYLERLRQLGDIQSPSLNAYMQKVMYKRRNSQNNFNNNGFGPVWVKVESQYKPKGNRVYDLGQKKQPAYQRKRLDFVLLTPQSISKKKKDSTK